MILKNFSKMRIFYKFIGNLVKLGEVGDIDIFSQLTSLSDSIGTVNLESVTKLDTFTTGVVNAMNAFGGISIPVGIKCSNW